MIVKPQIVRDSGDYRVRFHYLDFENGELVNKIVERYVNSGDTVVAPAIPTTLTAVAKKSCALTFSSWNHTTFTNITRDLDVGAIYDTTDTKTHAFVTVTATTGLSLPISYTKSDSSTLTISWGDGTTDDNVTDSGSTTHTYSTEGTYEITLWISSGTGTFSLGYNNNYFIGYTSTDFLKCAYYLSIGSKVTAINRNGIVYFCGDIVTIPNNVVTLGQSSLASTTLTAISLPSSITSLSNSCLLWQYRMSFISLPDTITSFTTENTFYSSNSITSIVLPNSLTSLVTSSFAYCSALTKVTFSSNILTIPIGCFRECEALSTINIPNSVTSILDSAFTTCYALKNFSLPTSLITLGNYAFYNCYGITDITIPSGVTNIPIGCFEQCINLKTLTLTRFTAPSTITILDSITGIRYTSKTLRIYVPVGSEAVYKGASNWSTYANQIYEDNATNRALFGD